MALPDLPRIQRQRQLSETVYEQLKDAIVENVLSPGQRLVEASLAEKFGVSTTPVREALARLEREGLVELLPARGALVATLTPEDFVEILTFRELLEAHAARLAAQRRDAATTARLAELVEACEPLVAGRDQRGYGRLVAELHRAIVQSSGNRRLIRVFDTLYDQSRIIRWRAFNLPGRPDVGHQEHRQIVAAIAAGDADAAERLVREHHRHTMRDVVAAAADLAPAVASQPLAPLFTGRGAAT
ncbi:MAG: GntR family transcriptional regulator [Chloroflexota bacterium]